MNTRMAWLGKRPLLAFFGLCFAISWLLWFPWITQHNDLFEILGVIGVFGPALACVIVARTLPGDSQNGRARYAWLPFVIAWGLSTWIILANSQAPARSPVVLAVFAILALPPAYVIASAFSGPPGVRKTLATLVRPSGNWIWYLLALLLPPTTRLVSAMLSRWMGWGWLSYPTLPADPLQLAGSVAIVFLYTLLFAGGLNEEAGWTGFALPGLLKRANPLVASIILWAFWILWHLPLGLAGVQDLGPHVLIGTFFGRFIFTWLYLRSSGGIWTAILFHASVNTASQFIPLTNTSLWIEGALAIVIVVGARMWKNQLESSLPVIDAAALSREGSS